MHKLAVISLILFLVSTEAFAYRPSSKDTSIYNECLWNKEALGDSNVECNDLFNHYPPSKVEKHDTDNLRLGSYNILWSEDEETDSKTGRPKKSYELNVKMIDAQWDLVALQELQFGSTSGIKEGEIPQYIVMLQMLRERDPSWGLLISPFGQSNKRELLGFFYRGSVVQPTESRYCREYHLNQTPYYIKPKGFIYREVQGTGVKSSSRKPVTDREFIQPENALACPLAFSETVADNFPKIPFMARFESGDFKFSYVSLHLGFRGLEEFDSTCMGVCQLRNLKLISFMDGDEENDVAKQIDAFSAEKATQRILKGTEVNLKKTDDVDMSYQLNLSKSLLTIHENGQLPESCSMGQAYHCDKDSQSADEYKKCRKNYFEFLSSSFISHLSQYDQCREDFETSRRKTYADLAKSVFKNIIFSEAFTKRTQGPGEDKAGFISRVFSEGSIASGLYNVLGVDHVISTSSEGREFPRLFQVNSILIHSQKMKDIEDSNDVIVAGDFNLEFETDENRWQLYVWKEALSRFDGAKLLIKEPTSLNNKRQRKNNYDHFILSPKASSECLLQSAHALDFLTAVLSNGEDLGALIGQEDYHFVMSDHLPISMTCSTSKNTTN